MPSTDNQKRLSFFTKSYSRDFGVMDQLGFFVLFLIIGERVTADLAKFRADSPTRATDVLGVIVNASKSKALDGFFTELNAKFAEENGIEEEMLTGVDLKLETVSRQFMVQSYAYTAVRLREYFLTVTAILRGFVRVTEADALSMSRFLDEHEYCLLAALHDWGRDVGLFFESLYFLQSTKLDVVEAAELAQIKLQVLVIRLRLDKDLLETMGLEDLPITAPKVTRDDHERRLTVIGGEITKLSNAFCPPCRRPFVRRYSRFSQTQFYDGRNEIPFVRHVIRNEKCVVTFNEVYKVPGQKNRITSWSCNMIMDSQEYRYAKYKEDVTTPNGIKDMLTKIKRSASLTRKSKPVKEELVLGENKVSLAALKNLLTLNTFYLNVVQFYNIAADVMLLVSIKEGDKILKGIRRVVQKSCKKSTGKINVREMRELRSTLFEFKSVLDDLVRLLLERERIDVTGNPHKKDFDARVKSVMTLLDFPEELPDAERVQRICREIPKELAGIKGKAHLGGNRNNVEFENYYFTQPIFSINELYRFIYETDF